MLEFKVQNLHHSDRKLFSKHTNPTNPEISPTVPTSATGPHISELVRQYTQELRIRCEIIHTDHALQ